MEEISQIIDQTYPLPAEAKKILIDAIEEVSIPKGTIFIHADRVEEHIYFIKKGIVRAFLNIDGDEKTFWFGSEGQTIISMRSYIENTPSYEDIETLEDCVLYKLNRKDLDRFFESNIHIANWGRKFAEYELAKTEERLIQRLIWNATQRYEHLMKTHPQFIQRIQLGHIASYLGITQVSLSRIRSEIN